MGFYNSPYSNGEMVKTFEPKTPILTTPNTNTIYVDIKKVIAEHGARQLGGQGITFNTDDEKLLKFFENMLKYNQLQDYFISLFETSNYYGAVFPIVEKNNDGEWTFSIASPLIFNAVAVIDVQPYAATYYKQYSTGLGVYWERTHITKKTITRNIMTTMLPDGTTASQIPEGLKAREGTFPNTYGFINVFRFYNKPARNFLTNYYIELSDDWNVRHIPDLINHTYRQLFKELIFNKTRIVGRLPKSQQLKLVNEKSELALYTADFYSETTPQSDTGQNIQTMMGDPKIQNYLEGIDMLWDQYKKGCLYSPQKDSDTQQTQAETLFSKSLDIETLKYKRQRFTELIQTILDKIFIYEGFMSEGGERTYSIEIRENVVYNEIQLSALVIQSIENDLMTHIEAISKLRGIDLKEAEVVFEEILKKNGEYNESMMEKLGANIQNKGELPQKSQNKGIKPKSNKITPPTPKEGQ